jgi:hypothetical protein
MLQRIADSIERLVSIKRSLRIDTDGSVRIEEGLPRSCDEAVSHRFSNGCSSSPKRSRLSILLTGNEFVIDKKHATLSSAA